MNAVRTLALLALCCLALADAAAAEYRAASYVFGAVEFGDWRQYVMPLLTVLIGPLALLAFAGTAGMLNTWFQVSVVGSGACLHGHAMS